MSDDSISEKNADKIINWIFSSHLDKTLDIEAFKKRIDNCCLYNYPKK